MKRWMLSLAGLLALVPAALGQEGEDPAARETLDRSLSWGVDRDSGKIAIDAYLLYFYDPENRVLVVNGSAVSDAAQEAGAQILKDGSWLMPDGTTLKPLLGEVAIYAGDEPEDLRTAMEGVPETSVSRVQLSEQASARAERVRWFRRCNRCNACPTGCFDRLLAQGGSFRTCGSGGFFTRCREDFRSDFCNPALQFTCAGCTGSFITTVPLFAWGCAVGC